MIMTRTPLRISFLGGGTDYPEWSDKHGGMVVGGTVDQFVYITARYLPPFHSFRTRLMYSEVECVNDTSALRHRGAAACLLATGMGEAGLEICHQADVPGRSGLGSSSAFAVGLLHALHALQGHYVTPVQLAYQATRVERRVLGETVGRQDQVWAAHGGLNRLHFGPGGDVHVHPLPLNREAVADLERHLLLYYTGQTRTASEVAKGYVDTLAQDGRMQWAMLRLAEEGVEALLRHDWLQLGTLMDRSWEVKRRLPGVTTPDVDRAYARARLAGAVGGKLLGAGGGGCLLLVVPQGKLLRVAEAMGEHGLVQIPFKFDFGGSRIVLADQGGMDPRPGVLD